MQLLECCVWLQEFCCTFDGVLWLVSGHCYVVVWVLLVVARELLYSC